MNVCILSLMTLFALPMTICGDGIDPSLPQEYCKKERIKPLFPGDEGYMGNGYRTDKDGKQFDYGCMIASYPLSLYSKAKFRIRVGKSSYLLGEKIPVAQYIWNASDIVLIVQQTGYTFGINDIKVINSAGKEVPLTEKGIKIAKDQRGDPYMATGKLCLHLAPNEVMRIREDCPMSDLFDMSQPDTYEITFYRWSVVGSQKYDTPLKSNTLKITVSDDVKPL